MNTSSSDRIGKKPRNICNACNIYSLSPREIKAHHTNALHQLLMGLIRAQLSYTEQYKTLEEKIQASGKKEPIIGLEYIYEYAEDPSGIRMYECKLCDRILKNDSIFCHIVGMRHRILYLSKHHPIMGIKINHQVRTTTDFRKLQNNALAIEQTHKKQKINVVNAIFAQDTDNEKFESFTEDLWPCEDELDNPAPTNRAGSPSFLRDSGGRLKFERDSRDGPSVQRDSRDGPSVQRDSRGGPSVQRDSRGGPSVQRDSRGGPSVQRDSRGGPSVQRDSGGGTTVQSNFAGGPSLQRDVGGGQTMHHEGGGGTTFQYGSGPAVYRDVGGGPTVQRNFADGPSFQRDIGGGPTMQRDGGGGATVQYGSDPTVYRDVGGGPSLQRDVGGGPTSQRDVGGGPTFNYDHVGGTSFQYDSRSGPPFQYDSRGNPSIQCNSGIRPLLEYDNGRLIPRESSDASLFQRDGGQSFQRDGDQSFQRDGGQSFQRDVGQSFQRDGGQSFQRDGGQSFQRDGGQSFQRDGGQSFQRDIGEGLPYQREVGDVPPYQHFGGSGSALQSGHTENRLLNRDADLLFQRGGGGGAAMQEHLGDIDIRTLNRKSLELSQSVTGSAKEKTRKRSRFSDAPGGDVDLRSRMRLIGAAVKDDCGDIDVRNVVRVGGTSFRELKAAHEASLRREQIRKNYPGYSMKQDKDYDSDMEVRSMEFSDCDPEDFWCNEELFDFLKNFCISNDDDVHFVWKVTDMLTCAVVRHKKRTEDLKLRIMEEKKRLEEEKQAFLQLKQKKGHTSPPPSKKSKDYKPPGPEKQPASRTSGPGKQPASRTSGPGKQPASRTSGPGKQPASRTSGPGKQPASRTSGPGKQPAPSSHSRPSPPKPTGAQGGVKPPKTNAPATSSRFNPPSQSPAKTTAPAGAPKPLMSLVLDSKVSAGAAANVSQPPSLLSARVAQKAPAQDTQPALGTAGNRPQAVNTNQPQLLPGFPVNLKGLIPDARPSVVSPMNRPQDLVSLLNPLDTGNYFDVLKKLFVTGADRPGGTTMTAETMTSRIQQFLSSQVNNKDPLNEPRQLLGSISDRYPESDTRFHQNPHLSGSLYGDGSRPSLAPSLAPGLLGGEEDPAGFECVKHILLIKENSNESDEKYLQWTPDPVSHFGQNPLLLGNQLGQRGSLFEQRLLPGPGAGRPEEPRSHQLPDSIGLLSDVRHGQWPNQVPPGGGSFSARGLGDGRRGLPAGFPI